MYFKPNPHQKKRRRFARANDEEPTPTSVCRTSAKYHPMNHRWPMSVPSRPAVSVDQSTPPARQTGVTDCLFVCFCFCFHPFFSSSICVGQMEDSKSTHTEFLLHHYKDRQIDRIISSHDCNGRELGSSRVGAGGR